MTPAITPDWSALDQELEAWQQAGLQLPLWWRDDDATEVTPQLQQLTETAQRLGLPVHLAIIPRDAQPELAAHLQNTADLIPVVHGWAHKSHAPEGEKKAEFGAHRPVQDMLGEAEAGLERLKSFFGSGLRPMFVPPWNRIAPEILPFAAPVWKVMNDKRKAGKRILFEGAQGALLDIDFGTYPFVTSSNVIAGQAATGVGIGPGAVDFVLGIVKAYTTRVGEGPFPTELHDEDGERLGTRGHEFGTTTGRKRRCGWFDAALLRQTCATSGVNGIALTKLDVLDGFETLKICVGYDLDGERLDYLPTAADQQARCTPIYEEMPGWSESTEGARSWAELPANAIKYVRRVEELIECPVALLSTSPEREDTILVTDPFSD